MNDTIIPEFGENEDSSLRIKLDIYSKIEKCMVLHLSGYIDRYNCDYLSSKVRTIIDHGYFKLVFEIGGMGYIARGGFELFKKTRDELLLENGGVVLVGIQKKVLDVFNQLGNREFFIIHDAPRTIVFTTYSTRPTWIETLLEMGLPESPLYYQD